MNLYFNIKDIYCIFKFYITLQNQRCNQCVWLLLGFRNQSKTLYFMISILSVIVTFIDLFLATFIID